MSATRVVFASVFVFCFFAPVMQVGMGSVLNAVKSVSYR